MSELRHANKTNVSGYLFKEGKRLKGKTKRYLALSGSKISHHVKEGQPPTWEIDVSDVQVSVGEREFEFILSAGGRSLSFFATSQQDFDMWIGALKSAGGALEDFYVLGKELGKGSYGEVFLATDKHTHEKCAVKIIRKNPSNRKQRKFIERERAIMTKVNHENIVKTFDIFDGPTKMAIVSEYMEGGELFDLIIASQYFTEEKARLIMRQILSGVRYLHENSIVHRDIKPENVLCATKEWPLHVKLTDFGLSNFIDDASDDSSSALLSHVGTSFYLAPEIVGKEGYGPAVDIWASGVVLYIMLCGRFPFWGKTDIEYMRSLSQGPSMVGEGWDEVSDLGKSFLKDLLQLDPKRRLNAQKALNHPWVRGCNDAPQLQKQLSSVSGMAVLVSKERSKRSKSSKGKKDRKSPIKDDGNDDGDSVSQSLRQDDDVLT